MGDDLSAMETYDPFRPGGLDVEVRTVEADDRARNRCFTIESWAPVRSAGQEAADGGVPSPLVVYSHHSGGRRRAASYLCTHLAGHGYVVAALDHSEVAVPELAIPADGTPAERIEWARRMWVPSRVPDVRFLIEHLLASATVDPERIGIVGHSFGGWTALASPENDARIGAVVALAPAGSEPAPPGTIPVTLSFDWVRDVPTMYLVASEDASLPLDGMHQLYRRTPTPKRMLILHRADHLHFVDDVETVHEAFRTAPLTGPAGEIQARMRPVAELCTAEHAHLFARGLTLAHFDATLRARPEAQRFLDGDLTGELATRGVDASVVGP